MGIKLSKVASLGNGWKYREEGILMYWTFRIRASAELHCWHNTVHTREMNVMD